jgi:hypothetical protein
MTMRVRTAVFFGRTSSLRSRIAAIVRQVPKNRISDD